MTRASTAAESATKIGAPKIRAQLRHMHREAHTLLLEEIADQTGSARRRCDAMSFGLWPSKGFTICGYEIKANRSDWLREIQDPTKADTFADHCDYWWILASPGVVKLEELPSGWGLMEPGRTNLRAKKPAAKRDAKPFPRPMLASLLRRAIHGSGMDEKLQEEFRRGLEAGKQRQRAIAEDGKATYGSWEHRATRAEKAIADFEQASGVQINAWDAGKVGHCLEAYMRGTSPHVADRAKGAAVTLRRLADTLEQVHETLSSNGAHNGRND